MFGESVDEERCVRNAGVELQVFSDCCGNLMQESTRVLGSGWNGIDAEATDEGIDHDRIC